MARDLCDFFVRSWTARVVLPLSRCVLRAPTVWLCCSWGGETRGVRAQLVRWPVLMSRTGVVAPCLWGGALRGLPLPPLFGPRLCVRGVLSPWQRAGRRPWEGGGR